MTTPFDFTSIADLGAFWDGTKSLRGGASMPGGGQFNKFSGAAGTSHNLDLLYQNLVGRNADSIGKDYWTGELGSGATTYQGVADAIKASREYIDQQTAIAAGASAADLKKLSSAYVSPFHSGSGSAVAGWQPGDAITQTIANAVTTDPTVTGSNYSDQTNLTVADVNTAYGVTDSTGGVGVIGTTKVDNTTPTGPGGPPIHGDPGPGGPTGPSNPYEALLDSFTTLQTGLNTTLGGYQTQINDLQKAYAQSQTDWQNAWNNMSWDQNRTNNRMVKGVRTQNELPGYRSRTGGTRGFFGRGGRGGGLTTSSLNI